MSTSAEQQSSIIDKVKLLASAMLVIAGITAFYYFETWQGEAVSLLYRVIGLLAMIGAAILVASTTAAGEGLIRFMKDARTEVRKMVWPTRNETTQTTLMVFVIVFIVAIFLWLVDMFLGWGVKLLLGGV